LTDFKIGDRVRATFSGRVGVVAEHRKSATAEDYKISPPDGRGFWAPAASLALVEPEPEFVPVVIVSEAERVLIEALGRPAAVILLRKMGVKVEPTSAERLAALPVGAVVKLVKFNVTAVRRHAGWRTTEEISGSLTSQALAERWADCEWVRMVPEPTA
jgi:hypothetical protein